VPAADVVELIKSDHRESSNYFDLLKTQPATRSLNHVGAADLGSQDYGTEDVVGPDCNDSST
jgi:hypothetical protein